MLLSFRVGNYRSFREEQSLSMLRSSRMHGSRGTDLSWDPAVSTVTGLYGANASGKSNLLSAMSFFRGAVAASHQRWGPETGVPRKPFLLDDACAALPSSLEMEFRDSGTRYQYGFETDDDRFTKEWLYAYPGSRRQTWFEREVSELGEVEWYFGKSLTGRNRVIADLTRSNSLFLSAAAANGHTRLTPVHRWVTSRLRFAHPENRADMLRFTLEEIERREGLSEDLREMLRFADLGVRDFRITKQELDDDMRERFHDVVRALAALGEKDPQLGPDSPNRPEPNVRGTGGTVQEVVKIELEHRRGDGSTVALPFAAESAGTQAVVALAGPIFHCLRSGSTLLVDEIDASLHPSLVGHLIQIFRDRTSNPRQAQLIFTSHDTSLLGTILADEPILARDQIWFVQKDECGASLLYPLTEFKPRKLENIERGYLQGRYGAVPFLDDVLLPRDPDPEKN